MSCLEIFVASSTDRVDREKKKKEKKKGPSKIALLDSENLYYFPSLDWMHMARSSPQLSRLFLMTLIVFHVIRNIIMKFKDRWYSETQNSGNQMTCENLSFIWLKFSEIMMEKKSLWL